ncbi:MAG: carboxypeptidase regulatory-like domain-containing protein [Acetivibrionales bacterium]|jgi:hypothetical protein
MSIIKDEYMLGQSNVKKIDGIAETVRLDLSLSRNPHINSGTITGIVKDTNGNPVSDAVVIVLDGTYSAIANTITGIDGSYSFSHIPSGSGYKAYAQSPGFLLAEAIPFNLGLNQTIEIDFTLFSDDTDAFSIITGVVLNTNGLPINSASVELYKIEETATKLLSLSFSNDIGQFVLRDLGLGSYFIKINATGFFSEYYPVEIKKPKSIAHADIILKEDLKASKGIIMGIITGDDEVPLANADVILYRVGTDKGLIPVAYTRTNHEGIYLFVNVPKGEYLVNSNRSILID